MTTFLETLRVSPPPAATEVSVPLTFFDIMWLHFMPIRRILFYDYACSSRAHFLDTLLPRLKQSLSLTLRHFLPVAGFLLYPQISDDGKKPFIRYVPGDSVLLTAAESGLDYDELVGNHARDADQFYNFVPQMPPISEEHGYNKIPLMAIQVTLFPGRGICIGFANNHCLGDARSIASFWRDWAAITKLGGDESACSIVNKRESSSLPVFDRSVLKDPIGVDSIFWKLMRQIPLQASSFPLPTNRVRATYTLHPADIKRLKNKALAATNTPAGLMHVSSFVVTTSYVWTCLLKSGDAVGEEVDDNVLEYFIFTVDARGRIDPPMPADYFGNCLAYGIAKMEHRVLVESGGFTAAAKAISEEIRTRVNNKEVVKGAANWVSEWEELEGIRMLGVSGSPRFDLCGADFGWGRARKLEVVSIDAEKYSMSLCRSGVSEEVLEVGLSLSEERMKVFAALFAHGLSDE